jgi:hypothetical protein
MDGFDFEDSLGSLGESELHQPVHVPPPKKQNLKEMFSEDSEHEKPKTLVGKGKHNY